MACAAEESRAEAVRQELSAQVDELSQAVDPSRANLTCRGGSHPTSPPPPWK